MMTAIPLLMSPIVGFVVALALVFKLVVINILSGHWRAFGGFAHSAFPIAFLDFYREKFARSWSRRSANAGYNAWRAIGRFRV